GPEQTTVRASRALADAPESTAVGPIHYEVIEPWERVRFRLEPNEVQPIAFGLKALILTVLVEDKEGGTEAVEASISEIDEVESVQVVAVTRML
ncbi:MAG: hypothetical protein ACXW1D_07785, partial [Halobacteriota archaeon]